MSFQDFDHLSERRKNERKQKLKKRITIAVVLTIVLLLIAAAAICAVIYKQRQVSSANNATTSSNKSPPSASLSQTNMRDQPVQGSAFQCICIFPTQKPSQGCNLCCRPRTQQGHQSDLIQSLI